MANIKNYKPSLLVQLYDWTTQYAEWTLEEIAEYLEDHQFIIISDNLINRKDIKRVQKQNLDEIDQFIQAQKEEIRNKLLEKKRRLKDNLNKEMSIKYAQNLVKQYLEDKQK